MQNIKQILEREGLNLISVKLQYYFIKYYQMNILIKNIRKIIKMMVMTLV